jgi:hypothetical protein
MENGPTDSSKALWRSRGGGAGFAAFGLPWAIAAGKHLGIVHQIRKGYR